MQMWSKVVHNGPHSAVVNMNGTNMHFVLVCFFSPQWCPLERSRTPSPSSLLSLHSICLFSNCDLEAAEFIHAAASLSLSLYVRHIRHSSPAEFDSITAQTSSHYLSAEHSLNVNVFLGRLHQCEILKNIPLIDNMNHQACVPSPLNTPFTILCGNVMKNCLHAVTCSHEIGLRCRFSDQAGFSTRIRTSVIGLIRANSCVGHASVMTYINTEQTCSLKNEVPHPSRR